ncbi:rab11 family-interacting protein 4B isoform X1 [Boleophthalmus pectinirostris]|uniref:rab11 family-interacting protein 4B isoform X1 n=2 Tax=Boleophthalmus pectinirostris TaxID=150288 RepID=UPI00242D5510|nr:rab11 family-interacting protein 4B isoform X1 [Boleophthalmus pectinirostris]
MDSDPRRRSKSQLTLLKTMKQVFDLLEPDQEGFVDIQLLVKLASRFGPHEQARKLVECLDPNSQGKISFLNFCFGVLVIKGYQRLPQKTDDIPINNKPFCASPKYCQGSEEEARVCPVIMCTRADPEPVPECQLFPTEVDEPEERESDRDSAVESTQGSDTSEGPARAGDKEDALGELFFHRDKGGQTSISVTSDLSTRSSASLNEEQFEDYGEGEEPDYAPSSPCPDDDTRTNGYSDLGSSVSSSAGQTPRKVRQHYTGELMDVYCSQCSKKVNLLNDLEARLKNLKANSPSRKISSTAFGRQLLHNSNLSSSNGSTEDLFRDSIDSCDIDINEKVSFLEKKVSELENEIIINGDLKSRLKLENTQLVHRVNELEEQLKDQEAKAEHNLELQLRRHREAYSKMEKDKNTQIELQSNRVRQLEEENGDMALNLSRLKSQTEKLDEEKQRMTDKLEDTSLRLKDEMDLYKKMMDKLRQNRQQFQKEKDAMQELIEDLRRELEHLQLFKMEAERPGRGRSSSSSLSDFSSRSREVELEHEVKRHKQENQKLKEQNEDLNGQILSLSLHEAKNLFATQTKAQSLAAEIDNATRDQLMEALKEQEEINIRLRQYMDKIILSILDHNPSILEIKQ